MKKVGERERKSGPAKQGREIQLVVSKPQNETSPRVELTYETSNSNNSPNTTMKSGNNAWLLTLRYPSCRQQQRRAVVVAVQSACLVCCLLSRHCRPGLCACCLPQQKLKFKQSKRGNQQLQQQQQQTTALNDSQLRCWRRCLLLAACWLGVCVSFCCWSFSMNSTSRRRRRRRHRLSLSSFLQLCLLAAYPTHTLIQTCSLTLTYVNILCSFAVTALLLLLLLLRRLHTHFMLCSLAHLLSRLLYNAL